MSFSSELKENLSKIPNLKNKELVKFELIGYLISNNTTCDKKNIYYTTVNEYNINRFSKLLSNMEISNFKIDIKGKNYVITLPKTNSINEIKYSVNDIEISSAFEEQIQNLNKIKEQEEMAIKALTRGIFLGSGSVNNPEKKYHLEIILSSKKNANIIKKLLLKMQIKFKELERKNGYSLYIKEGEEISKFLAFIGANSSVLKFEEIRVIRDMKNNVNRKVNCETANLNKTINAAEKQKAAKKKIKERGNKMKIFLITLCFMLSVSAVGAASDVGNVVSFDDDAETGDLDVDPPSGIDDINNVTYSKSEYTREPVIYGEDLSMYYKNGSRYEVSIYQDGKLINSQNNDSKVIFNVNGVNYTKELVNGKASIGINLNPGNYTITTFYHYTDGLATKTNNIEVLSTILANDVVKFFRNGTQYCAKFLDGCGSPLVNASVTFNINGVLYKKQTDDNGMARLNINLFPGEYILTAIHLNGEEKANIIKVLTTISAEDISLIENKSGVFVLKTHDGARNVSITINGVEYIVQTDDGGVATLNVSLSKGNHAVLSKNLNSREEIFNTIYVMEDPAFIKYYSIYGVSPDGKYIMAIGRPSAAGELSKYGYTFYKSVFERICPCCRSDRLYWGIFWAGSETANWGVFPATGLKESGSAEGHIFCAKCDADFSVIDGKNHGGGYKNLIKVISTVSSSKDEAYILKNGQMPYSAL